MRLAIEAGPRVHARIEDVQAPHWWVNLSHDGRVATVVATVLAALGAAVAIVIAVAQGTSDRDTAQVTDAPPGPAKSDEPPPLAPTATTSPPTTSPPSTSPSVRSTGSATLVERGPGIDLDAREPTWGQRDESGEPDLRITRLSDPPLAATSVLRLPREAPPNYQQCASATGYGDEIRAAQLERGAGFCVITSDGR